MLVDRATSRITIMASTEGGMDIEEVAERTPEKILKLAIDPAVGCRRFTDASWLSAWGLEGKEVSSASSFMAAMYKCLHRMDIEPLWRSILWWSPDGGEVLALDAKMNFDDNAL